MPEQQDEFPKPSVELMASLVFDDDSAVRAQFREAFRDGLDRFLEASNRAYGALYALNQIELPGAQALYVKLYLHSAVNCGLVGMHLLVSGYGMPAGNQFRSMKEAVAMAILLLDGDEAARFHADRINYPAHDAPSRLENKKVRARIKKHIPWNPKGWSAFLKVVKLYDHHSHASAGSLSYVMRLGTKPVGILGGDFDPEKRMMYETDIVSAIATMNSTARLIPTVRKALERIKKATPAKA